MVKQASGVVIAPPQVTGDRRIARRVRVYCTIIDAIRNGTLPPGARLPSARQLAADWGYARGAVEEAFAQLQIEGYIERRVGDGSYVTADAAQLQSAAALPATVRPLSRSAQQVIDRLAVYLGKPRSLEVPLAMLVEQPMYPRAPMVQDFPLGVWRRLVSKAHGEAYRDHLTYGSAAGLPRLREAIARHLSLARATPVAPQQVIVMNSPLHALDTIARVLLEPGDKVWLEDPGHVAFVALFKHLRMQVFGVPVDEQGIDVRAGRAMADDAALVYCHPIAQYPLCVRTSSARRADILAWAQRSGAWIVEGNFNDEVIYDHQPPGTMWSPASADRVLVMGTFEGIMYPSLRLAYVVVPERLVDVFVAMRGMAGDHSNTAMQLALAWFIDEGHLAAHVRLLRQIGRVRRDALRASCARHLPEWACLADVQGSFHACIHLPAHVRDGDVVRAMRANGVVAISLSSSCIDPTHRNGVVIGFGAFDELTIDRSMAVIGRVMRDVAQRAPSHQGASEKR
jgi:GntR family transcriptional regulator / MocR family aminotransferase